MKSYTDIEQSKKLAKILPLESADMWWAWYSNPLSNGHYDNFPMFCKPVCNPDESVPCWSLAALMNILPKYELNNFGDTIQLDVNLEALATEGDETLVDLVVNMIIHLHGLKQKPDNNVKPKFHEGDWLVQNERKNIVKVVNATPLVYEAVDIFGYHHTITDTAIENNYHLWTIQDAKDGDVLTYRGEQWIFIYKERKDETLIEYYALASERGLTINSVALTTLLSCIVPATEEQRDALMKAMADAGYEWDAENKQLRKIVDEKQIKKNLQDNSFRRMFEQKQVIDYPDSLPKDNWELIHEFVEKFGRIPEDEDELNALVEYVLKRQKSAGWSKDDEKNSLDIKCLIGSYRAGDDEYRLDSWIDGLKGRVELQNFTVSDRELAQAKKDAYNDALSKIEYHSDTPTFDDGWSAAIWYLKKRNIQPR